MSFKRLEISQRLEAEKVLADPSATRVEKIFAQRLLIDINRAAKARGLRKRAREILGPKPEVQNFASDADYRAAVAIYRDGLERLTTESILDDPASSLTQRRLAKQALEELERRERKRGTVVAQKPEVPTRRPSPPGKGEPSDSNAQRFLDALAEKGERVERKNPAASSEPSAPPPARLPGDCPTHQAPLSLCKCGGNEVCVLCLVPRKICSCPKGRGEKS